MECGSELEIPITKRPGRIKAHQADANGLPGVIGAWRHEQSPEAELVHQPGIGRAVKGEPAADRQVTVTRVNLSRGAELRDIACCDNLATLLNGGHDRPLDMSSRLNLLSSSRRASCS